MELFKLLGTIAIDGTDKAKNDINETVSCGESAETRLTSAFKKIGGAVVTYFATDKIINFGKDIVQTSAEVSAEVSAFNQIMSVNALGDYADKAQAKLDELANSTGMMNTRLTPYMTSMTAKFKGLGFDIDKATDLAVDGLGLATDASAFWDMSLDESMSHLNSFVNGSYEGGEAIGLFANETQLASYAIKTGLVKTKAEWQNLDEATKQATRLEYAQNMFELSGAVGQARKESDQYANTQADLSEKWRQFKALIGEPLLENVVTPAMSKLSKLIDDMTIGYENLNKFISEHKTGLELLGVVLGTITALYVAYKIQINLGNIMLGAYTLATSVATGVTTAFGTAMAFVTSPIGLVIIAIGALVAVGILLYKNWETVKNFVLKAWEDIKQGVSSAITSIQTTITDIWNAICEYFTKVWEDISTSFSNAWNSIVDFFTGIWESITTKVSEAWEFIKNCITVGLMFIQELFNAFIEILLIPWNFIWENFGTYLTNAWESMKTTVNNALTNISNFISNIMNTIQTVFTDVWNTISGFFSSIWDSISTTVSSYIDTIKTNVTNVFNSVKETVTNIWNSVKENVTNVWNSIKERVSSVVDSIKTTITNVFNSVKDTVTSIFNSVKTTVSNVWNSIKNTVSSVVNSVKTTVSNVFNNVKTSVSNAFNSIKNTATTVWNSIKSAITTPINTAKDTVKNVIDKIKGFFNFSWSLPKLKMPHVSIKGSFSLVPPSVPSFGIEWYKKAMDNPMVLESPTIFGMKDGNFLGGGEAGTEVVSGKETLMSMIREAVGSSENSEILSTLKTILSVLTDEDKIHELLVKALSDGSFAVVLDNREVGRIVRRYA